MFASQSKRPLNQKKQVTMPADMRALLTSDELEKGFSVSVSPVEGCLYLLKYSDFEKRVRDEATTMTPAMRREVLRKVEIVKPDKQGRIVVPEWMREKVGIKDEVVFIGNGARIEIWATSKLEEHDKVLDASEEAELEQAQQRIFDF